MLFYHFLFNPQLSLSLSLLFRKITSLKTFLFFKKILQLEVSQLMATQQVNQLDTPQRDYYTTPAKHSTKSSSSISSMVRVIVRVRPFLPYETNGRNPTPCVSLLNNSQFDPNVEDEVTVHLKDQGTRYIYIAFLNFS